MPIFSGGMLGFIAGTTIVSLAIGGLHTLEKKKKRAERRRKLQRSQLKEGLQDLTGTLLDTIDEDVREAMVEAESMRRRVAGELDDVVKTERRFSMRVDLQPGQMMVEWTNSDGATHSGNVINCSMNGLFFQASHFDAEGINRVIVPEADLDLIVTVSSVVRTDTHGVAVMLAEFENNEDTWMHWIELMTRLGSGSGT